MRLLNFLICSGLSLVAFRSFSIILIWSVIKMTGENSFALGGVIALMWLFNLISLPLAGDCLDRFAKKNVLVIGELVSIAFCAVFLLNHEVLGGSILVMALCASVLAATNSITSSSINSLIPFIAEKSQLNRAVGLAATMNSLQVIIGAIFGGSLIAFLGIKVAILFVVGLYVLAFVLLLFVSFSEPEQHHQEEAYPRRVIAGFKVLYAVDSERVICYTAMVTNFVVTPLLMVVVPYYVVTQLQQGATTLALFEASFAVGMLLGATLLSRVDFNRHRRVLPVVVGNVLIGVGIIAFSMFEVIAWQVFSLCVSGFGLTMKGVACNSIRSFAVPDTHRARLEGAIFFLCIATIPIGSQLFGYLIATIEPSQLNTLIIVMGVGVIATSFWPLLSKRTMFVLGQSNIQLEQLYKKLYPTAFGG